VADPKVIHSAVRPRKRSHNTPLALAGLGALAVAASISGGAGSASPVEAAGRAAPPSDPQAIRSVDFGGVAQPGSTCSDGLRFALPGRIPVNDGRSQVLDLAQLTQLVVNPNVAYADLNGDDIEEAVVHVTCTFGANGTEDTVDVWTLEGDEPVVLAGADEPPASLNSELPPKVQGVDVSGDEVVVTWSQYADDDPNCCPSQQAEVTYTVNGDELEPVGEPRVTTATP
jgi:LppP/LprE lipoprotein